MKCKSLLAIMAVYGTCCMASSAFATQWYDFTIKGNDLMPSYSHLQTYEGDEEYSTPREIGYFRGARRFKPGDNVNADMRTYKNAQSTENFRAWY